MPAWLNNEPNARINAAKRTMTTDTLAQGLADRTIHQMVVAVNPQLPFDNESAALLNAICGPLLNQFLERGLRLAGVSFQRSPLISAIDLRGSCPMMFPSFQSWHVPDVRIAAKTVADDLEQMRLISFCVVGYYDFAEDIYRPLFPGAPSFELHHFMQTLPDRLRAIQARQMAADASRPKANPVRPKDGNNLL